MLNSILVKLYTNLARSAIAVIVVLLTFTGTTAQEAPRAPRDWIAAPDGRPSAVGTPHAPLDLATALENPDLLPGDRVLLTDGLHRLDRDVTILASEITVQPVDDAEASIRMGNVALLIDSASRNLRFRHLTFFSEPTNRIAPAKGQSANVDMGWITVNGGAPADGMFADCNFHDLKHIGWWSPSRFGGMIYQDSTFWNFGWRWGDTRTGDGEYLYTQNWVDSPKKFIRNVIYGPAYSHAVQLYAEQGQVNHFDFANLILAHTYFEGRSVAPMDDITLRDSVIWNGRVQMGSRLAGGDSGSLMVDRLTVAHQNPLSFNAWRSLQVSRSEFINLNEGSRPLPLYVTPAPAGTTETWWSNLLINTTFSPEQLYETGVDHGAWQARDRGAQSEYRSTLPTGTRVVIYPAATAPRIAHLAVFNWDRLSTLSADVRALDLTTGVRYRLRNAYDPLVDAHEFIYNGTGTVVIDMVNRSIAVPYAADAPLVELDIRFGAFVLERVQYTD